MYYHIFIPFLPMLEGDEYNHLTLESTSEIKTKSGHTFKVGLHCYRETVCVISISMTVAAFHHPDSSTWIQRATENAISAIRLGGLHDLQPVPTYSSIVTISTETDSEIPDYKISMGHYINPNFKLNIQNIFAIFADISSTEREHIASLMAESGVMTIPLHYRYLSIYRALELLYAGHGELAAAFDRYQPRYNALELGKGQLRNVAPAIRGKCAHGKTSGNKLSKPYFGINSGDPELFEMLCLLQDIAREGFERISSIRFPRA